MTDFRDSTAWKITKRLAIDPARRVVAKTIFRDRVPLQWCLGANWGDALSPVLVELLSGKQAIHREGLHHDRYLCIGSILGSANRRAEVWGSGFISETATVIERPSVVHAVRGPLTREMLLNQSIDCPKIYGDPALLLPRFYNPDVTKRYSVGIIPHYIDKEHHLLDQYRQDPQVLILDIESGLKGFVTAVKSCEIILSSSLHGLICADTYGVPNAWIMLSDDVVGQGFKFRDYRLSIGAGEPVPVRITEKTKLDDVIDEAKLNPLKISLRKLLLACPFLSKSIKDEVLHNESTSEGLPTKISSPDFVW